MNTLKKPRELWLNPLDIPSPDSFKVTGAIASGTNPQNGEVLFREVINGEQPEVAALVAALTEIAEGRTHPEGSRYSGTRSPTAKQCASKALDEYRKARE